MKIGNSSIIPFGCDLLVDANQLSLAYQLIKSTAVKEE